MIRHEDVAAGVVELIEADGFNAHTGDPHTGPGSPHEESVQDANIAHDEAGGKADDPGHRSGQGPEDEHDDRADHLAAAPDVELLAGCASPFNQAVRRARCSAVT